MYQSDDISKLAQAMLLVQEHLQPAIKDANNPFIGNDYATLNSVMESCRHLLLQQGILVTQLPCPAPVELGTGHIGLETRFVHVESGQWLSSTAWRPARSVRFAVPRVDNRGHYHGGRRVHSLCAILGIVTEDDDGNAASMPVKQAQKATRPVEASQRQKGTSESSSSKGKISSASNRPVSSQQNLPNIDGVTFRSVQAEDGRPCIVAAGKTLEKKDLLRASGFRWNAQQKVWWKYADAA